MKILRVRINYLYRPFRQCFERRIFVPVSYTNSIRRPVFLDYVAKRAFVVQRPYSIFDFCISRKFIKNYLRRIIKNRFTYVGNRESTTSTTTVNRRIRFILSFLTNLYKIIIGKTTFYLYMYTLLILQTILATTRIIIRKTIRYSIHFNLERKTDGRY